MAIEATVAANADVTLSEPVRPARRPFHKDPASVVGWALALSAVAAYWLLFVRQPAPRPGQPVARLTAVEGRVRVKPHARETWTDARLGDVLHVGDTVQTEVGSAAAIAFDDLPRLAGAGSRVKVRPNSVVYIGGSAEASAVAWRVRSGRVDFSTGERATEVGTPNLRATASGNAAGAITVAEDGPAGFKVFRGQAEIETAQGQRMTLGENQAVQVDAAGRAGVTQPLPPSPELVAPNPRAQLPFVPPPGAVTTLRWNAVRDGVTYHVAIDYNVTQAELLLSAALDAPDVPATEHALTGLAQGRYFWRVAAVNAQGLEGAFSRPALFSVVTPEPPRPAATATPPSAASLTLQTAEEVSPGVLHVVGRTDPGARVTIDGIAIKSMPDGSFGEYVVGRGPQVVVRATLAGGRATQKTQRVTRRGGGP